MIYYDFVTNVDVKFRSVRLVVTIYRGNKELGGEQLLGMRDTQMAQLDMGAGYNPASMVFALVGTEQVIGKWVGSI